MPTFERFEDIRAWQQARVLTHDIYTITAERPFWLDFGLRDQIQRAAVSIMANIAEGFGRSGNAEFAQMLGVAKGSAHEVKSHLYVALDQNYLRSERFDELQERTDETIRLIGGLMEYLKTSNYKGNRFR